MDSAKARLVQLTQMISSSMPAIIAKPINLVLNMVVGNAINIIRSIPTAIANTIQTIQQKFADISDKLTAIMGELKAAVEKKISETFNELKKK